MIFCFLHLYRLFDDCYDEIEYLALLSVKKKIMLLRNEEILNKIKYLASLKYGNGDDYSDNKYSKIKIQLTTWLEKSLKAWLSILNKSVFGYDDIYYHHKHF